MRWSILCLTTILLRLLYGVRSHAVSDDEGTYVAVNPCAHSPAFAEPYMNCVISRSPPDVAEKARKKALGLPDIKITEVMLLICSVNKGSGDLLATEFLKEVGKKKRPGMIAIITECHKKFEHL